MGKMGRGHVHGSQALGAASSVLRPARTQEGGGVCGASCQLMHFLGTVVDFPFTLWLIEPVILPSQV